jgi:rod shape-determining protein MreC
MQRRNVFLPYVLILLFLSIIIFAASRAGLLRPADSLFSQIMSPFEAITYNVFNKISGFGGSSKLVSLKKINLDLTKRLVDQTKLIRDNNALKDQFQTENVRSLNLIPADIIGAPGFIPGISVPENLILDRGEVDKVKAGDAVIYQNNVIGKVSTVRSYVSNVSLITNSSSSFTALTLSTKALGVIKGQGGGEMILDNVLLSDNLKINDIVLTSGNVNGQGIGLPPDLIVGKIISVSKNPSDLFQKAEVQSLINVTKLTKVFIIPALQ